MSDWLLRGLRRGVLTTRYPHGDEEMPAAYRGRARVVEGSPLDAVERASRVCLSHAIDIVDGPRVSMSRCFQCGECARESPGVLEVTSDFETAIVTGDLEAARRSLEARARPLGRSFMIRHVDAGSDASCDQEVQALFNPFYDINRLGFFLTATPRHADVLLVTGVVTHAMAEPLRQTYEAMSEPRIVVAVGSAACSGSIFAEAAVTGAVDRVIPVDVKVAGAPPSPLSIMQGLWVAVGRTSAHLSAPAVRP